MTSSHHYTEHLFNTPSPGNDKPTFTQRLCRPTPNYRTYRNTHPNYSIADSSTSPAHTTLFHFFPATHVPLYPTPSYHNLPKTRPYTYPPGDCSASAGASAPASACVSAAAARASWENEMLVCGRGQAAWVPPWTVMSVDEDEQSPEVLECIRKGFLWGGVAWWWGGGD